MKRKMVHSVKPTTEALTTVPGTEKKDPKILVLYMNIYAREDFNAMVQQFLNVLSNAQKQYPGKPRHLYVDVEGHRNRSGGFDNDALEFLGKFLPEMGKHFTEVHHPLLAFQNTRPQDDNVPGEIRIK